MLPFPRIFPHYIQEACFATCCSPCADSPSVDYAYSNRNLSLGKSGNWLETHAVRILEPAQILGTLATNGDILAKESFQVFRVHKLVIHLSI